MTLNNLETSLPLILGLDPGRDKCGLAIVNCEQQVVQHQVVESSQAITIMQGLTQKFDINLIVIGDGTTSENWQSQIQFSLMKEIKVVMVNEANSTVEARDRYWEMYSPQGFQRFIPQGLRVPPRPVDDIVAIILIERYLTNCKKP